MVKLSPSYETLVEIRDLCKAAIQNAVDNTGPFDDFSYQRDQGAASFAEDILEIIGDV